MDPVSAIGLVATCTSLLASVVKTTSALNSLRDRFQTAELVILSLITQLSTLEASTSELRNVLDSQGATINQRENLLKALGESLEATARVISYIWDEVSDAASVVDRGGRLGRWVRTKHVFNESSLAPMKEVLRDQIQAIQLLLSVAALPTESDQDSLLRATESIHTLERARDDSSSLLWLRDADSRASLISTQTDTLSRLSMVFAFDNSVFGSKPYRAAVMATWKSLRDRRRDESESTRLPLPTRAPHPVSMLFDARGDEIDAAQALLARPIVLLAIVKHDFSAERVDELDCKTGEALISIAICNHEWIVAKPIGRLGGPGIVPISFLSITKRDGKQCESTEEAIQELQAVGVPSVQEWKKMALEYKTRAITVGKFEM